VKSSVKQKEHKYKTKITRNFLMEEDVELIVINSLFFVSINFDGALERGINTNFFAYGIF